MSSVRHSWTYPVSSDDEKRPPPEVLDPDTLLLALRTDADLGIPEDQVIELEESLVIELLSTRLEDGRQALLAFTSEDELREWSPEGAPWVEMRAAELLPLAFESGNDVVLVNPASERLFVIEREEFMRRAE